MLQTKIPLAVKFICGFIYSDELVYQLSKKFLTKKFGPIDFESHRIDFNFTDYYEKEMGSPLYRRFVSFKRLFRQDAFVDIKLFCIRVEKKLSINNKRRVNIDPGYLNHSKLVLTTTKDYFHRIYLGKGVFAEVTLYYQNGNFKDLFTTYPDYKTTEYKDIFLKIRQIYSKQIKELFNL